MILMAYRHVLDSIAIRTVQRDPTAGPDPDARSFAVMQSVDDSGALPTHHILLIERLTCSLLIDISDTIDNPRSTTALANLALIYLAAEFPPLTELTVTPGSPRGTN